MVVAVVLRVVFDEPIDVPKEEIKVWTSDLKKKNSKIEIFFK